jgi:hypothetical protein
MGFNSLSPYWSTSSNGHPFPYLLFFFFKTKLFESNGVGHHAPSIRLGDLDFSIALSLESHRHLRTSIIDSIAGEFPEALLTCSFVIHLISSTCTSCGDSCAVVKPFQFPPVFFLQSPAFTPPPRVLR